MSTIFLQYCHKPPPAGPLHPWVRFTGTVSSQLFLQHPDRFSIYETLGTSVTVGGKRSELTFGFKNPQNPTNPWAQDPTNPSACPKLRTTLENTAPKKPHIKPVSRSAPSCFSQSRGSHPPSCIFPSTSLHLGEVCCTLWLYGIPWLPDCRLPFPSEL